MRVASLGRATAAAGAFTLAFAVFAAAPAMAQAAARIDPADTAWMMAATALVLMMSIPGLALFYAGMVRKKNVLATMAQTFAVVALCSVLWAVLGYTLTFTGTSPVLGTLQRLFLNGMDVTSISPFAHTIPEALFMMYQMTFAVITVALVAGSVADRMRFSAFMWFSALWLMIVYVPIAHWVWGGGFLASAGLLDFAGGTVVHLNAGVAGLVAAYVIGARHGYGSENFAPYDLSLAVIGTGMLWIGWFGFNGGSALAADSRAVFAIVATHLAASAGAVTWMALEWWTRGKPSVLGMISGAVAGLGTITPASGFVLPLHGVIIGVIAGLVCFWSCTWLKLACGYDDSLDVFGVHGVGGATGTFLVGIFAVPAIGNAAGLLVGNGTQVLIQLYGIVVTMAWSGIATFVLLKAVAVLRPAAGRPAQRNRRLGRDPARRSLAIKPCNNFHQLQRRLHPSRA